jgi:hypothetical protein
MSNNWNYGILKKNVEKWLDRPDLSIVDAEIGGKSIIEELISLGERKIFRKLRSPANEKSATFKISTSTTRLTMPKDAMAIRVATLGTYELPENFVNDETGGFVPQQVLTLDYLDPYYFFKSGGDPLIADHNFNGPANTWTRQGSEIIFWRNLGAGAAFVLYYWADLGGMNDDEEYNEVLRIAPDLYLYGALTEAEAYLVNDPRIQVWETKFQQAFQELMDQAHQSDYSSNTLTMGR